MKKINKTKNIKPQKSFGIIDKTKNKRLIMVKFLLIISFSYELSLYSNGENFPFGMNNTVYSEFNEEKYKKNVSLYKQTIDSAASIGIKWWRAMSKFTWLSVEPDSGRYDWSNEDSLVKWTGERGLHILPVIGYMYPTWAHHDSIPEKYWEKYPFDSSHWRDYMKFTQAMAERYDGDGVNDMPGLVLPVNHWECMNEPYCPKNFIGDLKQYAEIFDSTRIALQRANPKAKLGGPCLISDRDNKVGWLSYNINTKKTETSIKPSMEMLNEIKNLIGIENIDFITHHIYRDPKIFMKRLRELRNTIEISIPIWITECGYLWYMWYHKYHDVTLYNQYFSEEYYPDTVYIADNALIYWVDTTGYKSHNPSGQARKYSELLDSLNILLNENPNYKFFFFNMNILQMGRKLKYDSIYEATFGTDPCTLWVRNLIVTDPLYELSLSRPLSLMRRNFKPLPAYNVLKKHIENNFHNK